MQALNESSLIEEVLKYIVDCYGAEIYQDKQRLSNLIADLYRGEEKKKRVYRRAILDDSLSVKVHILSLIPLSQRKAYYQQLISAFSDLNFYSEDFGKQIVDDFVSGLDMPVSISQECEELIKKAMEGDAVAQNRLGICYYAGEGIEQDYVEAVKWFQKSAEKGNDDAQNNLGCCYYFGKGVEQNYEEAVRWYQNSINQGNANAQNNMGVCYYNGNGILKNYEKAVMFYHKSAIQGNVFGQYNLGYCFFLGKGTKKNYKEAINWFYKSIIQGGNNVQTKYYFVLSLMYYQRDILIGNLIASLKHHLNCVKNKRINKTSTFFQDELNSNDPVTLCKYGVSYFNGDSVKKDINKALDCFLKAANLGDFTSLKNWVCIMEDLIHLNNFQSCVTVSEKESEKHLEEICYSPDKTVLLTSPKSVINCTVLVGTKKIDNYAFKNCVNLESIIMPNSLISIGDYSFFNCKKLYEVNIPNNVNRIGCWAFFNCSNLREVYFPNHILSIGEYAFSKCSKLKEINVPTNIHSISDGAFCDCTSLIKITLPDSIVFLGYCLFEGCSSLKRINIPKDSMDKFKKLLPEYAHLLYETNVN